MMELFFSGFSKIKCKSVQHIVIENSSNIEIEEEIYYTWLKNCKNIKAGKINSATFENCSNIFVSKKDEYSSGTFNNCKDLEFRFNLPKDDPCDITFNNCSGYLRYPRGEFWTYHEGNCDFRVINLRLATPPSEDERKILEEIDKAIQKNPQLLYDYLNKRDLLREHIHDGWWDEYKINTSLDSIINDAKKKIEENFDEDWGSEVEDDSLIVFTEYKSAYGVFYISSNPNANNTIQVIPVPKIIDLPYRDDEADTNNSTMKFDGKKWRKSEAETITFMGSEYDGTGLYREDFIESKDFFLK